MSLQVKRWQAFVGSLRSFDWSELRYLSASGYWPWPVYVVVCWSGFVLTLLLCCLVLAPGIKAAWHSTAAQAAELEREHAVWSDRVEAGSARLASAAARFPQWGVIDSYLRPGDAMPVVLDRLGVAAARHGATVAVLRPEKQWQQPSLQAFEIELKLSAGERQLLDFLADVRQLPFALAVTRFDWRATTSEATLALSVLLDDNGVTYFNRPEATTDAVGEASDIATGADVGGAGWHRVALVQRGNRYLEVLRDEHGEIRRRSGDRAGARRSAGEKRSHQAELSTGAER